MSAQTIRAALEAAVAAITPALETTSANVAFTPTPGLAYQRLDVLFATPLNDERSANYTEIGFLQVTLRYPAGEGSGAALDRAELIRETFPRGRTLAASDCNIVVSETPEIMAGVNDGDRWAVPVRIAFSADVTA